MPKLWPTQLYLFWHQKELASLFFPYLFLCPKTSFGLYGLYSESLSVARWATLLRVALHLRGRRVNGLVIAQAALVLPSGLCELVILKDIAILDHVDSAI